MACDVALSGSGRPSERVSWPEMDMASASPSSTLSATSFGTMVSSTLSCFGCPPSIGSQ
nr:hypothetical protein [Nocardia cyriacigeorgica]